MKKMEKTALTLSMVYDGKRRWLELDGKRLPKFIADSRPFNQISRASEEVCVLLSDAEVFAKLNDLMRLPHLKRFLRSEVKKMLTTAMEDGLYLSSYASKRIDEIRQEYDFEWHRQVFEHGVNRLRINETATFTTCKKHDIQITRLANKRLKLQLTPFLAIIIGIDCYSMLSHLYVEGTFLRPGIPIEDVLVSGKLVDEDTALNAIERYEGEKPAGDYSKSFKHDLLLERLANLKPGQELIRTLPGGTAFTIRRTQKSFRIDTSINVSFVIRRRHMSELDERKNTLNQITDLFVENDTFIMIHRFLRSGDHVVVNGKEVTPKPELTDFLTRCFCTNVSPPVGALIGLHERNDS